MANKNYKSNRNYRKARSVGKRKPTRKPRRKYSEVEKIAYRMGQVQRGLKNPDSLVSAAFTAGVTVPVKKERKTLF